MQTQPMCSVETVKWVIGGRMTDKLNQTNQIIGKQNDGKRPHEKVKVVVINCLYPWEEKNDKRDDKIEWQKIVADIQFSQVERT